MSLHKRLSFQRAMERRSLRAPKSTQPPLPLLPKKHSTGASKSSSKEKSSKKKSSSSSSSSKLQTPIDLELDLAAQQTKLSLLQDEIDRLKEIKTRMEEAKAKGVRELPAWLQEHEQFQQRLSQSDAELTSADLAATAVEDKKIEKMVRKTGKDIYKLRKTKTTSKGQLDEQTFKEKMAFFTTRKSEVPVLREEDQQQQQQQQQQQDLSRFSYEVDPDIGVIV